MRVSFEKDPLTSLMMEDEELRAELEALGELMNIHYEYLLLADLEPLDDDCH